MTSLLKASSGIELEGSLKMKERAAANLPASRRARGEIQPGKKKRKKASQRKRKFALMLYAMRIANKTGANKSIAG